MRPGDVVVAMRSSGLHSNGYSLVRRTVAASGWSLESHLDELGRTLGEEGEVTVETKALMRSLQSTFETYVKLNKRIPPELLVSVQSIDESGRLADTIVGQLTLKLADKQEISLTDLENSELLLLEEGHCLREHALAVCALAGAHERVDFHATSMETLRQMVAANAGVTLMPGPSTFQGRSSSSASMMPTEALSSSTACFPQKTASYSPTFSMAAARPSCRSCNGAPPQSPVMESVNAWP